MKLPKWVRDAGDEAAWALGRERYVQPITPTLLVVAKARLRNEMHEWAEQHIPGRYRVLRAEFHAPSHTRLPCRVVFKTQADLILFKLAWSEQMRRAEDVEAEFLRKIGIPLTSPAARAVFSRPGVGE